MREELSLGNLDARRDWGFAGEYVEAMWAMLQADAPGDYVVATGESHSVREVVEAAFGALGLDWERYVRVDQSHMRPIDVHHLRGDARKAAAEIGWKSKITFGELIKMMVEEDHGRWRRRLEGEVFPWDAPSYPAEAVFLTRGLRT